MRQGGAWDVRNICNKLSTVDLRGDRKPENRIFMWCRGIHVPWSTSAELDEVDPGGEKVPDSTGADTAGAKDRRMEHR